MRLLPSGLSLKNVEPTTASIFAYLRQLDKDELIPNSLQEHLSEAERVLLG